MQDLYKEVEKYTRVFTTVYRDIETRLILELAEWISEQYTLNPNIENILANIARGGVVNQRVLKILSEMTGETVFEIADKLNDFGVKSIDYTTLNKAFDKGYIMTDPELINVSNMIDAQTQELLNNFNQIYTDTRVGLTKTMYQHILKAQIQVESGLLAPNKAITNAVRALAKEGITSYTYLREGKEVNQGMEAVVRRNVRTSFIQTMDNVNEEVGKELGAEHWYMSQHLGARTTGTGYTNHAQWQGKVYTTEELSTVCGKGEIQGYAGINCRHIARPHIKGISVKPPKLLNMEELERVYALEQRQRLLERRIRATKREIASLDKLKHIDDAKEALKVAKGRLRKQQADIREHISNNDKVLRRDYSREKVII